MVGISTPPTSLGRQTWNFLRHFLEMCVAMCVAGGVVALVNQQRASNQARVALARHHLGHGTGGNACNCGNGCKPRARIRKYFLE